jgi:hypothetical protein
MYDLHKAMEIYKKHTAEDPQFDHKLVHSWKDKMPHEFAKVMFEHEYGCHIFSEEMYNEAVQYFESPDGSKGPHWSIESIKAKTSIDFSSTPYTCYDYCYAVNMFYSDFGHIYTEPSYYLKMAKSYLTDVDYFGDPSERAYHNAQKRVKYFKHK